MDGHVETGVTRPTLDLNQSHATDRRRPNFSHPTNQPRPSPSAEVGSIDPRSLWAVSIMRRPGRRRRSSAACVCCSRQRHNSRHRVPSPPTDADRIAFVCLLWVRSIDRSTRPAPSCTDSRTRQSVVVMVEESGIRIARVDDRSTTRFGPGSIDRPISSAERGVGNERGVCLFTYHRINQSLSSMY